MIKSVVNININNKLILHRKWYPKLTISVITRDNQQNIKKILINSKNDKHIYTYIYKFIYIKKINFYIIYIYLFYIISIYTLYL